MHSQTKLQDRQKIFFLVVPFAILMIACAFLTAPNFNPLPVILRETPSQNQNLEAITKAPGASVTPEGITKPVCPGGDCANLCVDKVSGFLQSKGTVGSPPKSSSRLGGPNNTVILTIYQINGDQISSPVNQPNIPKEYLPYQNDTASHNKIWNYYAAVIPADQRQRLTEFIIFTDGVGGILASVSQDPNNPSQWALMVDILDATNPRDLTYTLLHEFGHLLTLNDSQITPDPAVMNNPSDQQQYLKDSAACPQFFASNGCSKPDSYMNLFFQKFWVKIFPQWQKINNEQNQQNYMGLLGRFYFTYQSQFVSEYAVTSPEEDMAETWAKYI
jgi:hypothetical protein